MFPLLSSHRGKSSFEEFPDLFVTYPGWKNVVAFENAARIRIHHEDGMIPCVEQDGIGSFRSDAIQSQQLFTQVRSRLRKKRF